MEPLSTHNRGWHVQLLFLFLQVLVLRMKPSLISKSYGIGLIYACPNQSMACTIMDVYNYLYPYQSIARTIMHTITITRSITTIMSNLDNTAFGNKFIVK